MTECGPLISYTPWREFVPSSCGRTLHGKSRWRLEGGDQSEDHDSPASLMRSLRANLLAGEERPAPEPPHLAARLAPLPATRRLA